MRFLIIPFVAVATFLGYELVSLLATLHEHLNVAVSVVA